MLGNKSVIKHSAAVQITNKINLLQRRAWNILLANAYDELPNKEEYQLSIKDLKEILGIKTRNNDYLEAMLKDLMSCVVEWNILGKDKKVKWKATTLLAQAETEDTICTYAYSPLLRKILYNPAIYARISLSIQNKFHSKNALALYELCVDYFVNKENYGTTPFISIEKFKKLMGFEDNKYSDFKILNRAVIKPAIEEINTKADLFVSVEYKRAKRKIEALKFHIKLNPNNKNPLLLPQPDVSNPHLYKRLQEYFCLSPIQARDVLEKYDEHYTTENLAYVEEKKKKGLIKNIGAYTLRALKEDFSNKNSKFDVEKKQALQARKEKEVEEKLKFKYEKYVKSEVEKYEKTLSNEEIQRINEEARKDIEKETGDNPYAFKEARISLYIHDFLMKKAQVPSFEAWKVQNEGKT